MTLVSQHLSGPSRRTFYSPMNPCASMGLVVGMVDGRTGTPVEPGRSDQLWSPMSCTSSVPYGCLLDGSDSRDL